MHTKIELRQAHEGSKVPLFVNFGWLQLSCLQLEASCLQISLFVYNCIGNLLLAVEAAH